MVAKLFVLFIAVAAANDFPVIGILTQETHSPLNQFGPSYIAASYVKYLEAAGARVVPIHFDAPVAANRALARKLNGILFPGGGASLDSKSQFLITAKALFDEAVSMNDHGVHFPVWGTCLGFETLSTIVAGSDSVLSSFDSENLTLPLNLTAAAPTSRLFAALPAAAVDTLARRAVTLNNHMLGVAPDAFEKRLSAFFALLSTNEDRAGATFVSTMEARGYPIFGSQWHPEKNQL